MKIATSIKEGYFRIRNPISNLELLVLKKISDITCSETIKLIYDRTHENEINIYYWQLGIFSWDVLMIQMENIFQREVDEIPVALRKDCWKLINWIRGKF